MTWHCVYGRAGSGGRAGGIRAVGGRERPVGAGALHKLQDDVREGVHALEDLPGVRGKDQMSGARWRDEETELP